MMQDCQATQRLVHAYLDGELSAKEALDVQSHLEQCRACALVYRDEKLFLGLVKASLPSAVAPDSLRQEVRQALQEAGRQNRFGSRLRHIAVPTLTLVVFVLLVAVATLFLEKKPARDLVDLAVQKHQEYLNGKLPLDIASKDPVQVARWFETRTDFPVSLAQEQVKNLKLRGGRLVEFQDAKAAFLAYEMGQHRLSLVMTASKGVGFVGGQEFTFKQTRFYQSQHNGFQTLSWAQEGIAYVFVSEKQEINKQACVICHGGSNEEQILRGFVEQGI
jgi:anti-sigma factor RsiW